MDCRYLLAPAAAGLLLAATARARAEDLTPPHALQVRGGDFPALVLTLPADDVHAGDDHPPAPDCSRVRARRLDELPLSWRRHVTSVQLDCDAATADDAGDETLAITSRALLKPGRVRLAGLPVVEVRLMDSERWGDHQYVIEAPYDTAAAALQAHVETACRERRLREETASAPSACTMSVTGTGLFLATDEVSGIWIHPDPDDAQRTVYAEAWAD